jgi:hypothetical protein
VLDNEVVHFYWNVGVWVGIGVLLYRFGSRNPWLWVAFMAASLHMVEHFYLYWLYVFHQEFWQAGGWAGILGKGGLIGSPLDRPYLHFAYNYLEVVPLVIAFWDQSARVHDQYLARAFPTLSEDDLAAATRRLQRMTALPDTPIIRPDDRSERNYIIAKGAVVVVQEDQSGRRWTSVLRPGQSFATLALGRAQSRVVSAQATQAAELLALDGEAIGKEPLRQSDGTGP